MLLYRDSVGRKGVELYLTVSSAQRLFQGKTVLDFGCGVGGRTRELLRYTPEKIMGIDISRRNIEMASHGLSDRRLLFVAGDLSCLKGEELFDTIVSFTVFEHIDRELLPQILKRMSRLIKRDGKIVIVFNHYDCMFGSHVKEWVFHPWPQLIFRESELFAYWTDKNMIAASKASRCFFPQDYRHGIEGHNNDCYMNLNKIGIREFQNMIEDSGLKMLTRYDCSRIPLPLQLIGREHLQGSSVYLIER